uniref:tRNA synthetases class I catalytic domain-containing protein n=1 Tax=Arundo donax TaxID=35708 RepID=A0A0A9D5Y2_ARUDO
MAAAAARRATGLLPLLLSSPSGAHVSHRRALAMIPPPRPHRPLSHPARPFSIASASNGAAAAERTRELYLYNTKSRRKEQFRPRAPGGEVGMYVCGVTPYDDSHIGHARAYVAFDVLYRFPSHHYCVRFGVIRKIASSVDVNAHLILSVVVW